MDRWIQGIRPARLLLTLGAIAWLAGMLRPDASLPGGTSLAFTLLHVAPLGIVIAAAGFALTTLGTRRWAVVAAFGAGVLAMGFGPMDLSVAALHLGVAGGLAVLAIVLRGTGRALALLGFSAAIALALGTWPGNPVAPLDGMLVTGLGMLTAAPMLWLAFDGRSAATIATRVEWTASAGVVAGSTPIAGA